MVQNPKDLKFEHNWRIESLKTLNLAPLNGLPNPLHLKIRCFNICCQWIKFYLTINNFLKTTFSYLKKKGIKFTYFLIYDCLIPLVVSGMIFTHGQTSTILFSEETRMRRQLQGLDCNLYKYLAFETKLSIITLLGHSFCLILTLLCRFTKRTKLPIKPKTRIGFFFFGSSSFFSLPSLIWSSLLGWN